MGERLRIVPRFFSCCTYSTTDCVTSIVSALQVWIYDFKVLLFLKEENILFLILFYIKKEKRKHVLRQWRSPMIDHALLSLSKTKAKDLISVNEHLYCVDCVKSSVGHTW